MDDKLLTGYNLYLNMFYAMMIKRIYYLKNAPLCFIVQNLIIIALLIWFLTVLKKINSILDPPALKISLESYDDPIIVISGQNRFKKKYKDIIEKYNAQIIDIGESEIGAYMLFKVKYVEYKYTPNKMNCTMCRRRKMYYNIVQTIFLVSHLIRIQSMLGLIMRHCIRFH